MNKKKHAVWGGLALALLATTPAGLLAQEAVKLPSLEVIKDKPLPEQGDKKVTPAAAAPVAAVEPATLAAEAAPVVPVEEKTPDYSLGQALQQAYLNNPELEAQRREQNAVDERVPQALSGALPSASVGYEKGRRRVATGGAAWNYTDAETRNLTVNQPLFRGGTTWANVVSARNQVKAGQARLHQTEQTVLLNTVSSYMDVVQAQSVVELSRKNHDVLSKQQEASQQRFDVGEDTRTDVAQSQARVALAKSQLTKAEGRLAAVRASFKRLAGYELTHAVMPKVAFDLPETMEEAIAIGLANNPNLLEAKYLKESADYQINANAGQILPSVNLRGTMNRQQGGGLLGNIDFDQDELVVAVSVPIYQGGQEYSRVREARENYQRQRFTELDTANRVRQQVVTAWEDWQAANAALQSDRAAIDAAQIALDGVKQEQQYGARTTLDVLDAERELFDAQVQFVTSQRDEVVAVYGVLASLGKLTAQDLALNVPIHDANEHFEDVEYQIIGF